MSILIAGMEMPKKSGAYSIKIRLFVKEDGTASIWGLEEYIPHEPLDVIPVPPHGRLGDLDELARKIEHDQYNHTHTDGLAVRRHIAEYGHFLNAIAAAPTIIEAEEGE